MQHAPSPLGVPAAHSSLRDQLALRVDQWGMGKRRRRALETVTRPGYGVLETTGAYVRYRMHGSGPTVVFVTDPPIVLEHYDELVRVLEPDYTVLVMETPGFGFSSFRGRAEFAIEAVCAGHVAALHAFGRAPYILAYPCATAYVALAVARSHPELVSRLVLAQAPAWREELRWKARCDPLGVLAKPLWGQLALRAQKRRRASEWLAVATGSRGRRDEFSEIADRALREGAAFSLATVFQRYLVPEYEPRPVDHETLFLWGLRDRSHKQTDRRSSLELAPRAQLIESDRVGHFPELEDPAWFAQVLHDFVTRQL